MCGVFMGSSCAPRDKLNWTINIPDRKARGKTADQEAADRSGGSGSSRSGSRTLPVIPSIPVKHLLSLHDLHDPPANEEPSVATHSHLHSRADDSHGDSCSHQDTLGNRVDPLAQVEPERRRVRKAVPVAATFKVLQLTDLHFDPYFVPGARTDCGEPVCCRSTHGPALSLATMAGLWGEYTDCDTPFFTIENALQRMGQEHPDVAYWLMTGDLPPHDIWEYSRNETIAHIKFSSWLINHYSRDIGVFPVIGNHEAVPINR